MENRKDMRKYFKVSLIILIIFFSSVPAYYYSVQDKMIFRANPLERDFQFSFKTPFKELFIPVGNNEEINALFFPAKNSKGAILYLHGNGHNLAFYGKRASSYTKYGYDILMIDYRGFGKSRSTGFAESNLYQDSQAAYDYLLQSYTEDQILVYGQSLGTHMATWIAAHNSPKMLLLECPFYSMVKAAAHTKPLLPEWLIKIVLKYHMRTDKYIHSVHSPIVIFHGTDDKIVPYTQAQELFASIKDSKKAKLHTFHNWGHESFHKNPKYHDHLKDTI